MVNKVIKDKPVSEIVASFTNENINNIVTVTRKIIFICPCNSFAIGWFK